MTSKELVKAAVAAIEEKKGEDIKVIDISGVSVIADYFILASGNNQRQTQAIADALEERLGRQGVFMKQKEGYTTGNWILLDYQDVVIHIFNSEDRRFYNLERIWTDGKTVDDIEAL